MDGLVEHFNDTLKQILSKVVTTGGQNLDKILGLVLLAYRAIRRASTDKFCSFWSMTEHHAYQHHCTL